MSVPPGSAEAAVRRARSRSLLLDASAPRSPSSVVEWFGAMQGQDGPGVEWSVGLRAGTTRPDVAAALESAAILRTWPMRGTLHLVPGPDARWMVRHFGARALARAGRRRSTLGIDDATADRAVEVLAQALDASPTGLLGRAGCARALAGAGIDTGGQRAYHLLWYASARGVTCVGPTRSGEQTFALLDRWAPPGPDLDRPEALATIAGRFVRSHGPVTIADLARWADLTMADARAGAAAATGVITRDYAGVPMLVHEQSLDMAPEAGPGAAHALPGYDELVLGYRDRTAQLHPDDEARVAPGGNGAFSPTLVVDGRVVGTWRRTTRAHSLLLHAHPFTRLSGRTRSRLTTALAGFASFLGMPAEVRWPD